jgi:tetratricopeptide (TPR) repeat protein
VELSNSIHKKVTKLSEEGDRLASKGAFDEAIERYREAWRLLPEPGDQWEAATWLLTAVGDAQFLKGDFVGGAESLRHALRCPGGLGNPFIHLRLGQCLFESGDRSAAMDDLARAYMGAGRDIFTNENPKYIEALEKVLEPVPGSDHL